MLMFVFRIYFFIMTGLSFWGWLFDQWDHLERKFGAIKLIRFFIACVCWTGHLYFCPHPTFVSYASKQGKHIASLAYYCKVCFILLYTCHFFTRQHKCFRGIWVMFCSWIFILVGFQSEINIAPVEWMSPLIWELLLVSGLNNSLHI